jgi:hypothetical protein
MSNKIGVDNRSKDKSYIVKTALLKLTKCTELQNMWMTDEVWIEIIDDRFDVPIGMVITTVILL